MDVEPETLCLDIDKTKSALTPKTRAIMLVSANGRYPKVGIEAFVRLAEERGLILIEDAAQSLGSRFPDGRHIGRAGKVGSFSFSASKVITTGQGGCLITDDGEVAKAAYDGSRISAALRVEPTSLIVSATISNSPICRRAWASSK